MTDPERMIRLEEKVLALDKAIEEIKAEQSTARDCREESNITMSEIKGQLDALILKLNENKQGKIKASEIVISLCMVALALMMYLK